jgi:hypothetical protein
MLDSNREGIMNEADTCRTYVLPNLKSAGWEDGTITEQMVLTPERIVAYLNGTRARFASPRRLQPKTEDDIRVATVRAGRDVYGVETFRSDESTTFP